MQLAVLQAGAIKLVGDESMPELCKYFAILYGIALVPMTTGLTTFDPFQQKLNAMVRCVFVKVATWNSNAVTNTKNTTSLPSTWLAIGPAGDHGTKPRWGWPFTFLRLLLCRARVEWGKKNGNEPETMIGCNKAQAQVL